MAIGEGAFELCGELGAVDELVQGLQGTHHLTLPRTGQDCRNGSFPGTATAGFGCAAWLVALEDCVWLDTGTR